MPTRYPLENGKLFHGTTWLLLNTYGEYVYVMFGGANKSDIFWVEMNQDEFAQNTSFWKSVRLGEYLITFDFSRNSLIFYKVLSICVCSEQNQ